MACLPCAYQSGGKRTVRSLSIGLLISFVTHAYSAELIASHTSANGVEKLADSLVNRALKLSEPLHGNCLDNTVLAKTGSNMNGVGVGSPLTMRVAPCYGLSNEPARPGFVLHALPHQESSIEHGRKYMRTRHRYRISAGRQWKPPSRIKYLKDNRDIFYKKMDFSDELQELSSSLLGSGSSSHP